VMTVCVTSHFQRDARILEQRPADNEIAAFRK
jgi:hypothetical protein